MERFSSNIRLPFCPVYPSGRLTITGSAPALISTLSMESGCVDLVEMSLERRRIPFVCTSFADLTGRLLSLV